MNSAVDPLVYEGIEQRSPVVPNRPFQGVIGLSSVEPGLFVHPIQEGNVVTGEAVRLLRQSRYPLRKGAVAAPVERPGGIEVGVVPFLFVAPEARIAWQSHHVVHAGAGLRPLDPWAELFPLEREIPHNQVRAVEVADAGGPEVRAALDVELVIVADAAARRVLARLPVASGALCVALADEVPWEVIFGEPLPAVPVLFAVEPEGASVLRVCALLGLALGPLGDDLYLTLGWLIGEHAGRFPELLWRRPDASV